MFVSQYIFRNTWLTLQGFQSLAVPSTFTWTLLQMVPTEILSWKKNIFNQPKSVCKNVFGKSMGIINALIVHRQEAANVQRLIGIDKNVEVR